MARIGKYRFPVRRVDDVVELVRKLVENLPGETEKDDVAKVLGLSPNSGGFFALLSSMRMYGLIDIVTGKVRVTELGRRLSSPEVKVSEMVKIQIVKKIPLFRDLYEKYGREINENKLIEFLVEVAGTSREKAEKNAKKILSVYRSALPYLEKEERVGVEKETLDRLEPEVGTLKIIVETPDLKLTKIYPFNPESIELAKKLLESLKEQYKMHNGKMVSEMPARTPLDPSSAGICVGRG